MQKPFLNDFLHIVELRKAKLQIPQSLYDALFKKPWVVYVKRAFAKPEFVIEYLGRYAHKVAISNQRILDINDQKDTITISVKTRQYNSISSANFPILNSII